MIGDTYMYMQGISSCNTKTTRNTNMKTTNGIPSFLDIQSIRYLKQHSIDFPTFTFRKFLQYIMTDPLDIIFDDFGIFFTDKYVFIILVLR